MILYMGGVVFGEILIRLSFVFVVRFMVWVGVIILMFLLFVLIKWILGV